MIKAPIPQKIIVILESFDGKLYKTVNIWSDELAEYMINVWPELFWRVKSVNYGNW